MKFENNRFSTSVTVIDTEWSLHRSVPNITESRSKGVVTQALFHQRMPNEMYGLLGRSRIPMCKGWFSAHGQRRSDASAQKQRNCSLK